MNRGAVRPRRCAARSGACRRASVDRLRARGLTLIALSRLLVDFDSDGVALKRCDE
jgi:hypothetical protein